jgi:hypothetical protein
MNPATITLLTSASHWVVGGLLALAMVAFVFFFLFPAWRVGRELRKAIAALVQLRGKREALDLDGVAQLAMTSAALKRSWEEFRDTLHPQQGTSAKGEVVVNRLRATSTANTFFSEAVLVDTPLRTEFFKNLPGILTGLGIIGTFSGLIFGLQGFEVSPDPNIVRASLGGLLRAVGGAFMVSALAIFLAMFATAIEKALLTRRYADVERLCGAVDSLYESGAGEEYLARLVTSSETAATQAQHIKDALVNDLRSILTELTERQMSTVTLSNQQLGQQISAAVTDTLKAPLEGISQAVKHVANQQGDAVNKLLTDVLASFAARMESMFGGQLGGMNELLQQTAATMKGTAQQFEAMAARIEQAGSGATDKMADRMEALLQTLSERQAESNSQMTAFVEQMRKMVADGTSQNAELMQGTFTELSEVTGKLVAQLQRQTSDVSKELQGNSQALAEQMQASLAAQQALTKQMADQQAQMMAGAVERVSQSTSQMAADLQRQTTAASDAMQASAGNLATTLESAMGRQQSQMQASSIEQNEKMQAALAEMARVTSELAKDLQAQTSQAGAELQRQANAASDAMQASAGNLANTLGGALDRQQSQMQAAAAEQNEKMQATMAEMARVTGQLAREMQSHTSQAGADLQAHARTVAQQLEASIQAQQAQTRTLTEAVHTAATSMQEAVTRLRGGVDENITRLGGAAERLGGAATQLGERLQAMAAAASSVEAGVQQLTEASRSVSQAATTQQQALAQHQQVRDGLATMVTELRAVVDATKRDATLNERMVSQLEAAAGKLVAAQLEAETYLEGVTETLTEAHQAFANSVSTTLQKGNADFHGELSRAVDMLRSGIQDLADLFDNLPAAGR